MDQQSAPTDFPLPEAGTDDMANYRDSLLEALNDSLGYYVICEFIIGTSGLTEKAGILYNVGRNSLVLQDPRRDVYTICDLYSLKFVTVMLDFPPDNSSGSNLNNNARGSNYAQNGGSIPQRPTRPR